MKVKNEYIVIKIGSKEIKLHNMILKKYIDLLISNQFNNETSREEQVMKCCYIKFEDTLTVNENSQIYSNSFDLVFQYENMRVEENNSDISIIYNYNTIPKRFKIYDINAQDYITGLDDYLGNKITAIGFGPDYDNEDVELYACVDTNNYNLYLNDILFSITRKDIFSTDGYFYCPSDIVKSPVHMFSQKPNQIDAGPYYFGIPISIGLGLIPKAMLEEHTLLPYEEHIEIDENILDIVDELTVDYYDNGLYPATDLYPSVSLYPARKITEPLYPNIDIYPGEELYPLETPYLWYIFKYEIYEYRNTGINDTGNFYLISLPINSLEKIKSKIKYERA